MKFIRIIRTYFRQNLKFYRRQFGELLTSGLFIGISLIGNALVFLFATAIFHLERSHNPQINTYMDAVWWAFSTVTTVGYGDIVLVTFTGRLVGIAVMITGIGLFAAYTGLFAYAIQGNRINRLNQKFKNIEKEVQHWHEEHHMTEEQMEIALLELRNSISRLEHVLKFRSKK